MRKRFVIILLLLTFIFRVSSQDEAWREGMKYLRYSPRYFGPSAFPVPRLNSGLISVRGEVELRGEYHSYSGDRTKDVLSRCFIPIADGLAAIEVSYLIYEYYNMTEQTVAERSAAGSRWESGAHGDVIVTASYQLFRRNSIADVLVEVALKTASGNRLVDARFTDAATYWFDLNAGRDLCQGDFTLRLQCLAGFYCWMTNDMVHRQNDAAIGAVGLCGSLFGKLSFNTELAGIYGYENNGDRPLQLRTGVAYEHRNNALSLRFVHGFYDSLYDTFSLAFLRYF
jgi:hypothetical protein